jgi:hypothetical protein
MTPPSTFQARILARAAPTGAAPSRERRTIRFRIVRNFATPHASPTIRSRIMADPRAAGARRCPVP